MSRGDRRFVVTMHNEKTRRNDEGMDGLAREDGVQGIAQFGGARLIAADTDLRKAIVDAPTVGQRAVGPEHGRLGRHRRTSLAHELALRIEHNRTGQAKVLRVDSCIGR